jgi:hypothetical protein
MNRDMNRTILGSSAAFALLILLSGGAAAETLNPEGVNPHVGAPRKKITQEQKQAAAEARKKKKAEIEAKKKENPLYQPQGSAGNRQ